MSIVTDPQVMPEKLYCPYCLLVLAGNGHKHETQAWDLYNCEYNASKDERQPVRELEVNDVRIKAITNERRELSRKLKKLKARSAELQSQRQVGDL